MIYHSCTVRRRVTRTTKVFDLVSGEFKQLPEKVEVVETTCDTPLFSGEERFTGVCRSCRRGWSAEGNVLLGPVKPITAAQRLNIEQWDTCDQAAALVREILHELEQLRVKYPLCDPQLQQNGVISSTSALMAISQARPWLRRQRSFEERMQMACKQATRALDFLLELERRCREERADLEAAFDAARRQP